MTPAPVPPFAADETLWFGFYRGRLAKLKATVAGGDQVQLVFLESRRLTNLSDFDLRPWDWEPRLKGWLYAKMVDYFKEEKKERS